MPSASTAAVAAPSASTTTTSTVSLQPYAEYRFEVSPSSTVTIRLLSGNAEKDGTELVPNTAYVFQGTKTKINTWNGCELEVTAPSPDNYDAYTSEPSPDDTPMTSYINLHMKLQVLREAALRNFSNAEAMGPRVMVVGASNSGKTSLIRTLTGWATRVGSQPLVVNTDPAQGMLALPGTLSASVFATVIDITTEWGGTPTSAPTAIPVKLPLVYHYGLPSVEDNPNLYKSVLNRLAITATSRLSEDPEVKASGMLIDTGNVNVSKGGYELLTHIVSEFSVNVVIVLGSERMTADLTKRLTGQKTTLEEEIHVVGLDRSGGVAERDDRFMQRFREAAIKEYFFGDAKRTLSPFTQVVGFDDLVIWKINKDPESGTNKMDDDDFYDPAAGTESDLEKVEPSLEMANCILSVVYANRHDSADTVRDANVMGFVYVANADEQRRKLKILAPVSARLGDRPLVWGNNWPERVVSLLD